MLKPIKPKRISDLVYEQIKDLIFKGRFKPGEQLMTERELAQALGVSRPTVREAINRLVNIGLVEHRQGQGTFVTSPGDNAEKNPLAAAVDGHDIQLLELIEVRLGLECNAAMFAARRATTDDIRDMEKILREMVCEPGHEALCTDADISFHMAVSYASNNMVQIHIMKNLYDLLFYGIGQSSHHIYSEPGNIEQIIEQHKKAFEAIRRHDPGAAYEAMRSHISFELSFFSERAL